MAMAETATDEVVLYINTSYSKCGACGNDCDPSEKQHDTVLGYTPPPSRIGCHARYTHVSSHYMGSSIREAAEEMRPDLPWKPRMTGDGETDG
jgi:hypothetical protein